MGHKAYPVDESHPAIANLVLAYGPPPGEERAWNADAYFPPSSPPTYPMGTIGKPVDRRILVRSYTPKEFWDHITRPSKYGPPDEGWVQQVRAFVVNWYWGDEIWEYQWQAAPLAGEQGWYIVRNGIVVAKLTGVIS